MEIDWKNKPKFEDYPNDEVVWVVDLEMPDFSEFHVHLKNGEGGNEDNVEKYLDLDGFFWEVEGPKSDSQHYEVYREPKEESV